MQVFADIRSWENGEELVMDIFMPEAMLPMQLQSQPNKEVWGWRQLWWAVMVDAVCRSLCWIHSTYPVRSAAPFFGMGPPRSEKAHWVPLFLDWVPDSGAEHTRN